MLYRNGYYHGAAIVRLLDDHRCRSVRKHGHFGYVVNEDMFVFLKYTTKARTPWGFTFDQEDIDRCISMSSSYRRVVLGFICGDDGVCALGWSQARRLLAEKPGRIAVGRKHNKQYDVWGSAGELKGKIPLNHWPTLLFEEAPITSEPKEQYVGVAN
jgi:hypothetical protein